METRLTHVLSNCKGQLDSVELAQGFQQEKKIQDKKYKKTEACTYENLDTTKMKLL